MNRTIVKSIGISLASVSIPGFLVSAQNTATGRPNIVLILADDLGYNELGCYGQQIIKTPNIDKLASEGVRFTQFYSGSTVCAPSRCALLTGFHTGHAAIRDNAEIGKWQDYLGQMSLPAKTVTIGSILKDAGYSNACIGKWGLGGPGSDGVPQKQGFDYFYGYLCQRHAHNYYPSFLYENNIVDSLPNSGIMPHQQLTGNLLADSSYLAYEGNAYSQELITGKALEFISKNAESPFFLYLTYSLPHLALQVPDKFRLNYSHLHDVPYTGERGYFPNRYPHATYAAMISCFDHYVGMIMSELERLNLSENTLIIVTSDNGATFRIGGADPEFFHSNYPFRGYKTDLYEGGIRVPFIARWKGHTSQGIVSDLVCAGWDIPATLSEAAGISKIPRNDGISFLPELTGKKQVTRHRYLYWEFYGKGRMRSMRYGKWKAVEFNPGEANERFELYNLSTDISETTDISSSNKRMVRKFKKLFGKCRSYSEVPEWNF